ncbi:putative Phage-related protein [uncultured Stenotrophomonas sp.]|uniref:Putative Phage-related protein n=1 Tax=uncultured Stenotrophomonas sp. TaxID=165438 RepID=A0A1Y5Q8B3_9GAMM|nr:putative Phage-related protein [uncultured Stenotrophomonas sp.]
MSRWLAALLVAAALAWVGVGSAAAANCSSYGDKCDQGEAYSRALAHVATLLENEARERCVLYNAASATQGVYSAGTVSPGRCSGTPTWYNGTRASFYHNSACSSRPPLTGGVVHISASHTGPVGACNDGCTMMPVTGSGGSSIGLGPNPSFFSYFPDNWAATGDVCTKADTGEVTPDTGGGNDGEQCTQQDNLTQCMKPDGRHCAVASSGKEFCWQPGENGIKASGNDAATKSPQGKEAKPPPLPPNNGGDWEQKAQSTVVESKDGASNTSNVTSWGSSYGSQGQGASGNGASGEGKGGSGSGSGLGGGGGNGDGDDDGAGGVGDGAGDFYASNGKTVSDVFQAFKARVSASPLIDAVQGFFTVNTGGACPTFTVPASEYWEAMTYDAHCSGDFLAALQAIGWVLMAVAALAAAYWALS